MKNTKFNKIAKSRTIRKMAAERETVEDTTDLETKLRSGAKGKTYEIDGEEFELGDDAVGVSDEDADDEFVFEDEESK